MPPVFLLGGSVAIDGLLAKVEELWKVDNWPKPRIGLKTYHLLLVQRLCMQVFDRVFHVDEKCPDRTTAEATIRRHTFEGEGLCTDERELFVQVHDVSFKALEIVSLFVV